MERTHFSLNVKSILLILFLSINGCATTNNFSENYNDQRAYNFKNNVGPDGTETILIVKK